jgi:Transposase zinc-binding domain
MARPDAAHNPSGARTAHRHFADALPWLYAPRFAASAHSYTSVYLAAAIRENLETFLTDARETYERPLPRYVEKELRAYLRCGVFSFGFVRCRCDTCGHDLLVAFCCKSRGICPSCCGRRMANGAAHLVDRVLPDVPIRQFVLSLPYELRALAAFKPDVLRALVRIFVETVLANYRARAHREGIPQSEGGACFLVVPGRPDARSTLRALTCDGTPHESLLRCWVGSRDRFRMLEYRANRSAPRIGALAEGGGPNRAIPMLDLRGIFLVHIEEVSHGRVDRLRS